DHNTSTQDGSILVSDGAANLGFIFTNNITQQNLYGIKGAGTASGNSTIATFFPFSKFEKNIMVGSSTNYPVNNFYPPNINSVNFVNYNKGNGGDYHLSSASIYKNLATDGMDIGANVDSIILKTSTVISGITPNCEFVSSIKEKDSELNFVSVHPNPTKGSFKLRLSIAVNTKVTLIVYSLLGEKVKTLQENTRLNQGEYIYNNHIDIPGIYIIRAMIGNQESSYKLVVTK
ncbi:MAG: T9SS type A sorting domain-containing protein, partial [Saprospiraceae bacterium]